MPEENKIMEVTNVETTEIEKTVDEPISTRDLVAAGALLLGVVTGIGYGIKKIVFRKKKEYATVEPSGEYFSKR